MPFIGQRIERRDARRDNGRRSVTSGLEGRLSSRFWHFRGASGGGGGGGGGGRRRVRRGPNEEGEGVRVTLEEAAEAVADGEGEGLGEDALHLPKMGGWL